METHGRERRHRYYTVANFRALAAREGLDDSATNYANVDFSAVGGYALFLSDSFYDDEESLHHYVDSFKNKSCTGQARKNKAKNPIMPDGSRKLGRPRKTETNDSKKAKEASKACKRKREDGVRGNGDGQEDGLVHGDSPVKRGRPPKKPRLDIDDGRANANRVSQTVAQVTSGSTQASNIEVTTPMKRPRPQKQKPSEVVPETDGRGLVEILNPGKDAETDKPAALEGRGHPPKKTPEVGQKPIDVGDEEMVSAPEDQSNKRRRVTQLNSPLLAEIDTSPVQSAPNDTDVIIPAVVNIHPEVDNALGIINTQFSQSMSEEPRRSSRKRKRVIRDDETLVRKPPESNTINVQMSSRPQSTDSRTTPAQTMRGGRSELNAHASLHSAGKPSQSSAITIPIDPILMTQPEIQPMISEPSSIVSMRSYLRINVLRHLYSKE